ncbi:hypothetical protein [Amycolatopsis suaedae]|uniref:Uncharacterized protein n=1 Tax=Amycolatopsis suaedae TaxID=2510978 RepID=A0A4Q7JFA3_9PSEU|nr:hypothetical protein [Amycolatopsis suaedae]RZQ65214.1 hypothetical protein EWH70_04810 [Amycolatopsis suaedae]
MADDDEPVTSSSTPDSQQPYHRKRVLPGPQGAGPPLAWEYGDRRWQWGFGGGTFVLCVIIAILAHGFGWIGNWGVWVGVVAVSGLAFLVPRGHRMSAGTDWLNIRGTIVRTYELTEVNYRMGSYGTPSLELKDRHGAKVEEDFSKITSNQKLWDLVGKGIEHSLANGAAMNKRAQREFPGAIRTRRKPQPRPPT